MSADPTVPVPAAVVLSVDPATAKQWIGELRPLYAECVSGVEKSLALGQKLDGIYKTLKANFRGRSKRLLEELLKQAKAEGLHRIGTYQGANRYIRFAEGWDALKPSFDKGLIATMEDGLELLKQPREAGEGEKGKQQLAKSRLASRAADSARYLLSQEIDPRQLLPILDALTRTQFAELKNAKECLNELINELQREEARVQKETKRRLDEMKTPSVQPVPAVPSTSKKTK